MGIYGINQNDINLPTTSCLSQVLTFFNIIIYYKVTTSIFDNEIYYLFFILYIYFKYLFLILYLFNNGFYSFMSLHSYLIYLLWN